MIGEIFAVLSAVLWGIAPILDRYALSTGVSVYTALAVRAFGALFAMPFIVILLRDTNLTIRIDALASLLIAGAIGGAIAMIFYYRALETIGASRTVPITAIYPMFTALFSLILLSESITAKTLLGIVFIVIGVILVSEV
ncbi:MAG: EamA family transporter [Archaeoglobaceae archaeon]|nr:EamA family transporter [Archaeoglobaceae archaeon]MDW8117885.1 EamA family transporter [Archaeoglobaceae archaeon]